MHMILRTLLIYFFKPGRDAGSLYDVTKKDLWVLPTDLDTFMHVNNGVYFSLMDLGRWDHTFKKGIMELGKKNGWYPVVAGEAIRFKRSLKLWEKFTLHTQLVGNDEKYFYIRQNFVIHDKIAASGIVKIRFLKKSGGTVSAVDVMKAFGEPEKEVKELSKMWSSFEADFVESAIG